MMRSIWEEHPMPRFLSFQGERSTDVLIIGGGMAGLLTAYLLKQQGVNCIVVEKGRICSGATAKTTAKLTYQHGLIYHKLAERGLTRAQGYLEANRAAFRKMLRLCERADCDLQRKDNYVYTVKNKKRIEAELSTLQKIGQPALLSRNFPLPFPTVGAVTFRNQAQFHPLKLASSLVSGMTVFENTHVLRLDGNIAVTDRGTIRAKAIVVSTHFPFVNKYGAYFLKLYQHRSYVLALEGAPNVRGMYVDDEMTGMSFRNYKNLLLIGGGGHRTGKNGGNWQELRQFTEMFFPNATVRAFWAAQDCISLDGMPYIGRYSLHAGELYVASGFNKWGMTGSMLAASQLTDALLGRKDPYAELFSPSRAVPAGRLLANVWESARGMVNFSAKRCPHMGCALKWNRAEHSWDCPCHGSRLSKDGKIIDNPANRCR